MFLYLKTIKIWIGFFILVFGIEAVSQTDSTNTDLNIWQILKSDTKDFLLGSKHSLTQPLRWKKKDFITLGSVVAGTSILYVYDYELRDFFLKQNKNAPNILKEFGFYYGSPQNFFIVSGGIYGVGLLTNNEKIRKTAVLIITSAAVSGLIQSVSKTVIGRARPSNGADKFDFDFFSNEAGYHSLPSGHTVLTFSMAHSIAKQFESVWVKAGIYGLASIPPISRLWADAHWFTDVALGAVISIAVVDCVDKFLFKEEKVAYSHKNKLNWQLQLGVNTVGIIGTF
jgi:membrane-associated phospholipid phosphatase